MPTVNGTAILGDETPLALAHVLAFPIEHPSFLTDGRMVSRSVVTGRTSLTGTWSLDLQPGAYRIHVGSLDAFEVLVPEDEDEHDAVDLNAAFDERVKTQVLAWAMAESFTVATPGNVLLTSEITWPDGMGGIYTCTMPNEEWAVADAFTITYLRGGLVLTITQPAVTRDDDGVITTRPDLTIA